MSFSRPNLVNNKVEPTTILIRILNLVGLNLPKTGHYLTEFLFTLLKYILIYKGLSHLFEELD